MAMRYKIGDRVVLNQEFKLQDLPSGTACVVKQILSETDGVQFLDLECQGNTRIHKGKPTRIYQRADQVSPAQV